MRVMSGWRDWSEPEVRERPIGVLLITAVSALVGAAILLAAVELFMGTAVYQDWTQPKLVGNDLVGMVKVYPEHYVLMGSILLLPALYLIALAVGMARQRPWAWILGFVAGGLIALYGVLALVIPGDEASQASEARWHPAEGLPWMMRGVLLLWYFNRRSIQVDLGMGDRTFG